jgi:hypothetical protein
MRFVRIAFDWVGGVATIGIASFVFSFVLAAIPNGSVIAHYRLVATRVDTDPCMTVTLKNDQAIPEFYVVSDSLYGLGLWVALRLRKSNATGLTPISCIFESNIRNWSRIGQSLKRRIWESHG